VVSHASRRSRRTSPTRNTSEPSIRRSP
jgi:hypothetical protein